MSPRLESFQRVLNSLLDSTRYGLTISRLKTATESINTALAAAKRSGVSPAVLSDVNVSDLHRIYHAAVRKQLCKNFNSLLFVDHQSLQVAIATSLKKLERENDLIYHDDIPSASTLPLINGRALVAEDPMTELLDPAEYLKNLSPEPTRLIFDGLEAWGIRRARGTFRTQQALIDHTLNTGSNYAEIYVHQRDSFISEDLVKLQRALDSEASTTLTNLNLPASLEALSRPISLPPSLLSHAEEVRSRNGPELISQLLTQQLPSLSQRATSVIDETFELLDDEAAEDEEIRDTYGKAAYGSEEEWIKTVREPSVVANEELTSRLKSYMRQAQGAREGDAKLLKAWEKFGDRIRLLAKDKVSRC